MDEVKSVRSATMQDVAQLAGVSHMTVSRVVNGYRSVKPETRRAVEQAMATLNFTPNALARALTAGEPPRIALLHRHPNPGTLGELLLHLLDRSAETYANLVVRQIPSPAQDGAVAEELVARGVRGVLLAPPLADDPALVALLRAQGMAIVAIGSMRHDPTITSVGIDDHAAAGAMTRHLLELGHRRIGFITGHPDHASSKLRLEGFREAMAEAGAEAAIVADGRYTYQSGLAAAETLLEAATPPSAVFASNDDMAAATLAVAHRLGLDVPGELSVAGFDDNVLATAVWPALTTVRSPTRDLTRHAFALLLQEIAGTGPDTPAPHAILPFELVQRESVAPRR
ncbi:LacI family DNA-binding transcriptional regulator [Croceibacterium sp. TMG7-5b_MA50]|uniref:LacI family DNA-binding transcriptional regulator n=1 Tax=Croceibacterium sp. TMG7-5b_MA50 TaxID=3121290 RepID=UPI003221FA13